MQRRWISLGTALLLGACGGGGQIGGTISGLTADGLSLSNGIETINLASGATTFQFPTIVDDGQRYAVVVVTQPNGLQCTVGNGSGTAASHVEVSDIAVDCKAVWSISGTIIGLARNGLTLNNSVETVAVAAGARTFAFPTRLPTGTPYVIAVATQPANQTCRVNNGSGSIGAAAVTDVVIDCN